MAYKRDNKKIWSRHTVCMQGMKFIWLVEDHLALMECEFLILGGD